MQDPSLPPPGSDPFVSVLLAVPRLLARRSSCDEPLQLHSIAYLATATTYCRLRTEMGVPGWSCNAAGETDRRVDLSRNFPTGSPVHELTGHVWPPLGTGLGAAFGQKMNGAWLVPSRKNDV